MQSYNYIFLLVFSRKANDLPVLLQPFGTEQVEVGRGTTLGGGEFVAGFARVDQCTRTGTHGAGVNSIYGQRYRIIGMGGSRFMGEYFG